MDCITTKSDIIPITEMKMLTILAQKLLFMVKSRRRINDSFERMETLPFVEFLYIFLAGLSIVLLSASLIHIMH